MNRCRVAWSRAQLLATDYVLYSKCMAQNMKTDLHVYSNEEGNFDLEYSAVPRIVRTRWLHTTPRRQNSGGETRECMRTRVVVVLYVVQV